MISPFGASVNRAATSRAEPRTISSKRFVSSRQTATGRSGSASASERSDPGSRLGDSNATTGPLQEAVSSHRPVERLPPPRQIPDERIALADEPAGHKRGLDCGRAREHGDLDTALDRRGDEPRSRVVHARKAGVARERDPLAPVEPRQQLVDPLRLVMAVVADELGLDPVTVEECARPARVLAEDEVGLAELAQDPQRDVLEVADRRRADDERHQCPFR